MAGFITFYQHNLYYILHYYIFLHHLHILHYITLLHFKTPFMYINYILRCHKYITLLYCWDIAIFFFCNYKTYCIKCLLCLPHVSAKDNAYSCVQYIHLVKFGIGGEITRCSLLTSCYHVIKRDIFFFFFIFIILNDIHTVITRHVYFFYYYYYFSIEHYCLLLVVFMHSLRW